MLPQSEGATAAGAGWPNCAAAAAVGAGSMLLQSEGAVAAGAG